MERTVISYQLDLVVQLIDTTTGKPVREQNVNFQEADKTLRLIDKGDAGYILLNHGRYDFCLKVSAFGYEETQVSIEYASLDRKSPCKEIYLLPLDRQAAGSDIVTLTGTLPGIEAIEAVNLEPEDCRIREFDERKRILTLSNPHRLTLRDIHYGVVMQPPDRYEPVRVMSNLSDETVKIDRNAQLNEVQDCPLKRVIFGMVKPDGTYLLRVRDNSSSLKYLVRYLVHGTVKYQTVDMREESGKELA